MTDLQIMALCFPIALVVLVGSTVLVEEMFNQAAMKRENASARFSQSLSNYNGSMTVEFAPSADKKLREKIDGLAKRRAG